MFVLGGASFVLAQGDDYALMERAVVHAARVDAYNAYCESESTLSEDFIVKFREARGISEVQVQALVALKESTYGAEEALLAEEGKGCKDVAFMLKRLEVMRELKDISYLLNGIDPETIPGPEIPDMEALLPSSKEL